MFFSESKWRLKFKMAANFQSAINFVLMTFFSKFLLHFAGVEKRKKLFLISTECSNKDVFLNEKVEIKKITQATVFRFSIILIHFGEIFAQKRNFQRNDFPLMQFLTNKIFSIFTKRKFCFAAYNITSKSVTSSVIKYLV
jgi:hypothetical protein